MQRKELLKLLAGFRRFRVKYFDREDSVYRRLGQGQTPKTLIIACSDSRVDPAILSSAEPGEIFVVRNVANLVPPFEMHGGFHGVSAAIEFAVENLQVLNVIVLGHRQCGGIRELMSGASDPSSFVGRWMSIVQSAKDKVLHAMAASDVSADEMCRQCERESIKVSIANLRSFPFVQRAIHERGLNLVGAYFDLEAGQLFELDELSGEFAAFSI